MDGDQGWVTARDEAPFYRIQMVYQASENNFFSLHRSKASIRARLGNWCFILTLIMLSVLKLPKLLFLCYDAFLKRAQELPVNSCAALYMHALPVHLSTHVSNSHWVLLRTRRYGLSSAKIWLILCISQVILWALCQDGDWMEEELGLDDKIHSADWNMSTKHSEFPVSLFLLVKNLSLELSLKNKTFSLRRQLVGTNYLTTSVCNPAAR